MALSKEHLQAYVEVWVEYDPKGKGRVHRKFLLDIVSKLPHPLGFAKPVRTSVASRGLRHGVHHGGCAPVVCVCGQGAKPPSIGRVMKRLYSLETPLIENVYVSFWDFGSALARLVYSEQAQRGGEAFADDQVCARGLSFALAPTRRCITVIVVLHTTECSSAQCNMRFTDCVRVARVALSWWWQQAQESFKFFRRSVEKKTDDDTYNVKTYYAAQYIQHFYLRMKQRKAHAASSAARRASMIHAEESATGAAQACDVAPVVAV
jgi:hypothetical protein